MHNLLRKLLAWTCLALVSAAPAQAAADLGEYSVKAAFLFNFAKFTEWPNDTWPSRDAPMTLCIAGRDPFGGATLAAFDGRSIGNREFRSRRGGNLDELAGCQVLFIAISEERRLPAILQATANRPILTISDIQGFVGAGGMIGLLTLEQRIQFDVNLAACERAGLKLSAQMLMLARQVSGARVR